MHCRTISVALSGLGVLGVVAAAYLAAQPSSDQATATLLFPKDPKDHLFWPTNQSWLWSVKPLDPAGLVGAVQRRFPFLSRSVKYTGGEPDVMGLAIAEAVRKMLAATSASW